MTAVAFAVYLVYWNAVTDLVIDVAQDYKAWKATR